MLIVNQHSKKRIQRQTYKCKIINNEHFAQFMTVKPNEKLIYQKENKNPPRQKCGNT